MDVLGFASPRLGGSLQGSLNVIEKEEEYIVECTYNGNQFALPVPEHLRLFACRMRNNFLACFSENSENKIQEPCSDLQLLAQFLRYLAGRDDKATTMSSELFSKVVDKLNSDHLQGKDIHTRAAEQQESELESKQDIIKSYFEAMHLMRRSTGSRIPHFFAASHPSERTPTYTVFGGQGNTQHYFQELRDLYRTYGSLLDDILDFGSMIFDQLLQDETVIDQYPLGLDFFGWLKRPETTPDSEYLLSAPVSFPLIALGQLCHFYIACKIWQLTPGEVVENLAGSTGHSQGIIVAAGIATCRTWDDFEGAFRSCLIALFCVGCRSQQQFPRKTTWQKMVQDEADPSEEPTPMMNIMHLQRAELEKQINAFNKHLPDNQQIAIALVNGPSNIVTGGPPESLKSFAAWLEDVKKKQIKANVKPLITRYLPITAPFHTFYLAESRQKIIDDMVRHNIVIKPSDLLISVYDSKTGADLREVEEEALFPILADSITTQMVDWPCATTFPTRSCIIDFGPGESSGVGTLLHRSKEGTGTRVILAGPLQGQLPHVGYKPDLFDVPSNASSRRSADWLHDFEPTLLSDASGRTIVSTKMSQLLGTPPLMVAGMTPTTVHPDFVAAVINAGYHVELAAGGYHKEDALVKAIRTIEQLIPAGKGITLNLIYSAPRSIQWQIPLIKNLIAQGTLIDGITLGAGVPSLEVASGYIEDIGLKHISFKPGNMDAIQAVLTIAKAHPSFPIMMQWTGGRGGGHHSSEDFHDPILQTYASIRRCPNIILVAGSGFGGPEDTYPYLTGSWASRFHQPPMPFDGVLFGSRMMVAKEAHTSLAAKQAIAACQGVEDAMWQKCKGILTVKSEMGQPIHKIATRGVQLWAEFDKKIFSLPKNKQLDEILKSKDYIIERLNRDFQKVWFGYDFSSGKAVDLKSMTYQDVARRMVNLLYLSKRSQWIDPSYVRIFGDFVRRIEERLPLSNWELTQPIFTSYADFDEPFESLRHLAHAYQESKTQLINQEDQDYFLSICRRAGQKPVPFIAVLDANFETSFKKDSLWQSEFVDAVVDEDVQRTCILQGPVAVMHSTPQNINEPIKEILDRINDGHLDRILQQTYGGSRKAIPTVEFFGHHSSRKSARQQGLSIVIEPNATTFKIPADMKELPSPDSWFDLLAGKKLSWRYAVFKSKSVMSGHSMIPNPIRQAFAPAHNLSVMITDKLRHNYVSITMSSNGTNQTDLSIATEPGNKIILRMYCYENANIEPLSLEFRFSYHPETPHALLHESTEGRTERICDFYKQLWVGQVYKTPILPAGLHAYKADGGELTITEDLVERFMATIGGGMRRMDSGGLAPMDIAIVVGWKSIMKALLLVQGDLLKLVHLSNKFRMYDGVTPLQVGDNTESHARVTSVSIGDTGKTVEVCATITRDDVPVMDVVSEFFYRGTYTNFSECFTTRKEDLREVQFGSASLANLLLSKEWITFHESLEVDELAEKTLVFELETFSALKSKAVHSHIHTTGKVYATTKESKLPIEIGTVHYDSLSNSSGTVNNNPVTGYLDRHGSIITNRVALDRPITLDTSEEGFVFSAPSSNAEYSRISLDFNPIHVSPAFARYAGLPGPITHGMHTSAIIRSIVEMRCAENNLSSMRNFSASFAGMIKSGDSIEVHLDHIAMQKGNKIIKIEARNVASQEKVFAGECEVEPVETAFVFTGQGSQEVGMGMDLRATSAAARKVWDVADKHFDETYGFLLTHIIQHNPKTLKIHFGGPRGARIRNNYLNMTYDSISPTGTRVTKPFFNIAPTASSYTYRHPKGLLFSTEFAQPALTVVAKAAYEDMVARGLVHGRSRYAGHSLGEYAALGAVADLMPLEQMLSIVFYRGLSMQVAVERDEEGRSAFGMMAVDPSRVCAGFTVSTLEDVVKTIALQTEGGLLEIVNYNVEGRQYVCAGTLSNLAILTDVCNALASSPHPTPLSTLPSLITSSITSSSSLSSQPTLTRGTATIPLAGIDVPFHSSFLRPNLAAFREVLERNIRVDWMEPEKLVGSYVDDHIMSHILAMLFVNEAGHIPQIQSDDDKTQLLQNLTSRPLCDKMETFGSVENGYLKSHSHPTAS
ncbi:acyl transferase domain-containing protein [Dendryphion nanum]|uniref:Acyl transferase domain-containing protein n=1 Tax=Dendryphion nanum TaxID=256645 RepID=A0A9P9DPP5_9PLEO|nr:acyl transferase domain-containing protein [Dendryphion nanum]